MTVRDTITVDGVTIRLTATSQPGLNEMKESIAFVNRTPDEIVATFEDYNHFAAEIVGPRGETA